MSEEFIDEYWGIMVFGMGVLLMGIGSLFKRWFGEKS
jgi:hypothetical protein